MSDPRPSNPQPPGRAPLDSDEWIAVVVAFLAIGAILFWGLGRREGGLGLVDLQRLPTSPPAVPTPEERSLFDLTTQLDESLPASDESLDAVGAIADDPVSAEPGERRSPPIIIAPLSRATVDDLEPSSEAPAPAAATLAPVRTSPTMPTTPAATPTSVAFPDVPQDYWAAPFIAALVQRDITTGLPDGTFQPDRPITRAEFASTIQAAFTQVGSRNVLNFTDVPANNWAAPAIQAATRTGFMSGYPGGVFRPDQPISRLEILISLISGLGLDASANPVQVLQVYKDRTQIPDWAAAKIVGATAAGLVVGHPDPRTLHPTQPATRAEASAMIYQALVATEQAAAIPSEHIVRP